MRAIIIADYAIPSGGAQRVAVESARALAEAGVAVTYFHAIAGTDPGLDHPLIDKTCLDVPDVWTLNPAMAALKGVWNGEAARRLAGALAPFRGAKDTILHLHQWTRAFSPAVLGALRDSGLPTVITAHDYFLACPNGVLFRFDKKEPCALRPMSLACVGANCDTRSYPHKLVRVARQAATNHQWGTWAVDVIHIADGPRRRLEPMLPAHWRHHRVDNPIAVAKSPSAVIADNSVFAMVGRLTEDKGALLAARAAARIGAGMLFIGDGPARDAIISILPGAEITGWVGPSEVERLLRARARALLAPSLWPETGPLTVPEAAAMGLPAIVSSRCGASERVDASVGRVAEPEVEPFAEAMRGLLDNSAARGLGQRAYERFWANPPDLASHARELQGVYEGMLG